MPRPLADVFSQELAKTTHHADGKILQSISKQYVLSSLHAPTCMAFCPIYPKVVKGLASSQPLPSGIVRLIASLPSRPIDSNVLCGDGHMV